MGIERPAGASGFAGVGTGNAFRAIGATVTLVAAAAVALALQWPSFGRFAALPVVLVCLGTVAFAGAGVLLWQEKAQRPNAALFGLTAVLFAWEWAFTWPHTPIPFLALPMGQLFAIVLGLILLRYPGTRLTRPSERIMIVIAVCWTVIGRLAWALCTRPEWFSFGIARGHGNLPASTWWPTIYPDRHASQFIALVVDIGQLLVVPTFLFVIGRRLRTESPLVRREVAPVMAGLVLLAAVIATHLISVLTLANNLSAAPHEWISAVLSLTIMSIPLGFIVAWLRRSLGRAAIADLVVELARTTGPAHIQSALRRTLNDDSLTVKYWIPESRTFVDVEGRTGVADPPREAMTAVLVTDKLGGPLAVVYADAAHQRHPRLLNSAVAASTMAIQNARLETTLRIQLKEVRASRSRIVEAALIERRRMERDLHDGAQQQLLAIAATLGRLATREDLTAEGRELVHELRGQLRDASQDLRDLARGLHPALLSQAGLRAALEVVTERLSLPIRLQISDQRWSADIEATAYYVVCEAITNAVKHAVSDQVVVTVLSSRSRLHIEVSDNGHGGAQLIPGGGLTGIRDRVQAMGGDLTVIGGHGSTVTADLPCE